MKLIHCYLSDYGHFNIPDEIFEKSCIVKDTKYGPTFEVVDNIKARHFWNWLNEQEILAGKVNNE
jgi:hypothetical protein